MSIVAQCAQCRKKFKAPDKLAGQTASCPGCGARIRLPAPEQVVPKPAAGATAGAKEPAWYILSEDGDQLGPISKEQLDNLATQGRLSFCQLRRQDWRQWKWADDLYPDVPVGDRTTKPKTAPKTDDFDRLVTCPDCGNRVSRRAAVCPHCGCPAAVLAREAPKPTSDGGTAMPPPPPPTPVAGEKTGSSWRFHALMATLLLLLVAMVATPLYIWWKVHQTVQAVAEPLGIPLTAPEPPPPIPEPEQPGDELLSPEGKTNAIDEAARQMARHMDDLQSRHHLPASLVSQTLDSVKMLEALAAGDLDAIPESTGAVPGGSGVEPYESQYEPLFIECRDYVRENVKRGACTRDDVWQTARQWVEAKEKALNEQLGGLLDIEKELSQ